MIELTSFEWVPAAHASELDTVGYLAHRIAKHTRLEGVRSSCLFLLAWVLESKKDMR